MHSECDLSLSLPNWCKLASEKPREGLHIHKAPPGQTSKRFSRETLQRQRFSDEAELARLCRPPLSLGVLAWALAAKCSLKTISSARRIVLFHHPYNALLIPYQFITEFIHHGRGGTGPHQKSSRIEQKIKSATAMAVTATRCFHLTKINR